MNQLDLFDTREINSSDREVDVLIHIGMYKRSGRKYVTTIEGLDKINLDLKKIAKFMGNEFCCGKAVVTNDKDIEIITLQGDHRQKAKNFLIREKIISSEQVKIHGY